MKVFKTWNFHKWAKKEKVSDAILKKAIDETISGLSLANLGEGLFKKRIARAGSGKRGGHRVLLAFKSSERLFFIFGFSKNDRENIDSEEKLIFKKLAGYYLSASVAQIKSLCESKELIEVHYDKA